MPESQSQDQVVVQSILRPRAQADGAASAIREKPRYGLIGLALAVLVLLAVGVFVYLPTVIEPPPAATPDTVPAPAAATEPETAADAPPERVDYLQLALEMDRAEQSRGAYEALLASYERRGAARWAGEPLDSARAAGGQALKQFEAREYVAAREQYEQALEHLQTVAETADRIVREQLARGTRGLDEGQSAAAREAFETVLQVDPGNQVATRGLKRAGTLDEVFALTTAAAEAERLGEWSGALEAYEKVLALDPDMTRASEGLARVRNRIAEDSFATAMSQAMQALSAGEPAAARAALERAARIRPGAAQIQDALARAGELERQQQVLVHQRQGRAFEDKEQWQSALAEYEAALKIDPSLQFALQGRARVQPRLAMHEQFENLIGQPERLLSPAVRDQAQALLQGAGRIEAPGPVLGGQIGELSLLLERARTPVEVVLKSDNLTQVAINRVAQLGAFGQHRMSLLPGRYVVVGTRQGYRDVRREFTVLPGSTPEPLTVQCEEQI
jgi:tetratricopeptide (TPR) repeat protein